MELPFLTCYHLVKYTSDKWIFKTISFYLLGSLLWLESVSLWLTDHGSLISSRLHNFKIKLQKLIVLLNKHFLKILSLYGLTCFLKYRCFAIIAIAIFWQILLDFFFERNTAKKWIRKYIDIQLIISTFTHKVLRDCILWHHILYHE